MVDQHIGELLGLPQPSVRAITGVVRSDVTDLLVRLLPGVERSRAAQWLITGSYALTKVGPDLARAMRPDMAFGHSAAAALPGTMLYVIGNELIDRYQAAGHDAVFGEHSIIGLALAPSRDLRRVRENTRTLIADHPTLITVKGADAMATMLRLTDDDSAARAWGGWSLLAAAASLDAHRDALPEPGRARDRRPDQRSGADKAGFAFQLGRVLLASSALRIIDAERDEGWDD
jgi:hypothetical protein